MALIDGSVRGARRPPGRDARAAPPSRGSAAVVSQDTGTGRGAGDPTPGPGRGRRGRDARRHPGPHQRPLPPSPRARRPSAPVATAAPAAPSAAPTPGSAPQHEPAVAATPAPPPSPLLPGLPRRGARCGPLRERATARRPPPPGAGSSRPRRVHRHGAQRPVGPLRRAGQRRRGPPHPDAISVHNGLLTIRGDARAPPAAWPAATTSGRQVGDAREVPEGRQQYHPVLLLWPEGKWPDGGEVDFAETTSASSVSASSCTTARRHRRSPRSRST